MCVHAWMSLCVGERKRWAQGKVSTNPDEYRCSDKMHKWQTKVKTLRENLLYWQTFGIQIYVPLIIINSLFSFVVWLPLMIYLVHYLLYRVITIIWMLLPQAYNIHINGVFHCTVRYRQLHSLHEQLKRDLGGSTLPPFPPKKLLPLSPSQTEERRLSLEKYILQCK